MSYDCMPCRGCGSCGDSTSADYSANQRVYNRSTAPSYDSMPIASSYNSE